MRELIRNLLDDESFTAAVKVKVSSYNENEKIILQGDSHKYLYVIETGQVRVILNGHLNKHVDLHPGVHELGPGDLFGEFGLFDNHHANADFCSVTKVSLIGLEKKSLREFMDSHKVRGYYILSEMITKLASQLRHANNTVVNLYCWGIKNHAIDKYLS